MKNNGLAIAAIFYISIDYLRHISPSTHQVLQPLLWIMFALASIVRIPFYRYWHLEFYATPPFIASMVFMVSVLFFESVATSFATGVVGLKWHSETPALPDMGQWLLLALNEKLPSLVVEILRTSITGLHHYLMLFMMLAFSVLFNSVKSPGLGLASRYMFTMALGRILRIITFLSTILPSPRPWCASQQFKVARHPHPWAQKYHIPYASNVRATRLLLQRDSAYAYVGSYPAEHRPYWGAMSFLSYFLRPRDFETPWCSLLATSRGGCNDLVYSGHMFTAVLTAMAWTDAYGGWSCRVIWLLVMHSAQRQIRERRHYSVDVIVAICVGILLWRMTDFIWSEKDTLMIRRLVKLAKIQSRLVQAAKDSDMDTIKVLLKEVDISSQGNEQSTPRGMFIFGCVTVLISLSVVILALKWTRDG